MSDKYQIEVLLRPAVEFYAAVVTFAAAFILLQLPQVLMMPPVVAMGCAAFFILLGFYDVWRGCKILRYRRRMSREKPLQINNRRVPIYEDRLYLGEGFEWSQKHTQRYIDTFDNQYKHYIKREEYYTVRKIERFLAAIPVIRLLTKFTGSYSMLNPWPPRSTLFGDSCLHGVEGKRRAQSIGLRERRQHMYFAGTTGTGKTEALEMLVMQDIHRASKDVVIVFDPKGSASLMQTMYAEAHRAGRGDDLVIFHLGFPEVSAMYDATGNYTRITEIASRLARQLPGDGEAAVFREFGWQFINLIVRVCDAIGEPANLGSIKRYISDMGGLLGVYGKFQLKQSNRFDLFESALKKAREERGRTLEEVAMLTVIGTQASDLLEDNDILRDLYETVRMDPGYYRKLVASVRPLLDKMTSGQLDLIMSPSVDAIKSGRQLLEWEQVIRRRQIVYVGLDAMAEHMVAQATGKAMLSDLVATASRIYKEGVLGDIPGGIPNETFNVWLHMDEVDALMGDEFIPMVNKIRGAGVGVAAYSQTVQDFEVALGNRAKRDVVTSNFNSLVMFRIKNIETASLLTDQVPKVKTVSMVNITQARDTDNMLDGSVFVSSNEDRVTSIETEMITPSMVMSLPTGHAFASIEGGRIIKLNFPWRVRNYRDFPDSIRQMGDEMRRRYQSRADWYDA